MEAPEYAQSWNWWVTYSQEMTYPQERRWSVRYRRSDPIPDPRQPFRAEDSVLLQVRLPASLGELVRRDAAERDAVIRDGIQRLRRSKGKRTEEYQELVTLRRGVSGWLTDLLIEFYTTGQVTTGMVRGDEGK